MALSPLNESGKAVEWWFIYKVPELAQSAETAAANGTEYAYYDDPAKKVVASPYQTNGKQGALAETLAALFDDPSDSKGYILYNDERPTTPPKDNGACGHTKGVLGFDVKSKTGFWLLHSWPKYPAADGSADPAPNYGQTYLCLALSLDQLGALANQMVSYQQPQVYDSKLPAGLPKGHGLRTLAAGVNLKAKAGTNVLKLTTPGLNGRKSTFQVIAKNSAWNDDFWNDLVAPALKTDLDVETWIRGGAKVIPSTSDPTNTYTVADMKFVSLKHIDAQNLPWEWPEVKDHAKWAISEQGKGDWICVGDINRMISQRKRGGCTIAFKDMDNALWSILYETDVIVAPAGSGWSEEKTRKVIKWANSAPDTSAEPSQSRFRRSASAKKAAPARKAAPSKKARS
ncbi:MAG TPA: deoxyribonuclease II family protein [Burkholderiaceae bacterium]